VACDLGDPASQKIVFDAIAQADVVIHLAWLIQPSHNEAVMRATNVDGTRHLLAALKQTGQVRGKAPALVAASSVGAYAPGPKVQPVNEAWPTEGVPTSVYSRHKVAVERMLDDYERSSAQPVGRVVRIRPGVVLSGRAASSQARYFLGPFLPMMLLRRSLIPVIPAPPELAAPIVHSADAAAAFVSAALRGSARGAFNIAADEPLSGLLLAAALRARPFPVPGRVLRTAADLSWRLHLQPTDPGWVDLALQLPIMSTERARQELGWVPAHTAADTVHEWLQGMRHRRGGPSPVLRRSAGMLDQAKSALPTVRSRDGKPV
jgi:nucleoside-diphosphate-sugar epimerase